MLSKTMSGTLGAIGLAIGSSAAQAGDPHPSVQLAQGEQRMVCSAGLNAGYRIDFGRNRSRRICVTFRWLRGVPTGDAPPAGHCRWDGRAPSRAELRIRRFCQDLRKDFRVERRGVAVRYKSQDALYLDRIDDPSFRFFIYVRRMPRHFQVIRVGPWSR